MLPALQERYKRLNTAWHEYRRIIGNATPEQQNFKPAPDKWCMLQVAQHVMASEAGTLRFFKKYPPIKTGLAGQISGFIRSLALTVALKLPLKFKAPKVPDLNPQTAIPWDQTEPEWVTIRAELDNYFNSFPPEKSGYIVFKHPVGGKFNISQTLDFLLEHINHHLLQLQRIQQAEGYPAAGS